MQVTANQIQYQEKRSAFMKAGFDLTVEFPGTDVLLLTFARERPYIYDFTTLRFASIKTDPESKSLIAKYLDSEPPDDMQQGQDEKGTAEHGKNSDGNSQGEVPRFKFKRYGSGSLAIINKERYDAMFPQFKAHALRRAMDCSTFGRTDDIPDVLFMSARVGATPYPQSGGGDHGGYRDDVPEFKFKRAGGGQLAIVDKAKYDAMFPQFKAHAVGRITSKRIPANHRYKIEKRVKDHHRKLRKDAKNKPNAHHKNKKDPGIPNNFPGKEKILQQIADQKLKAQEEKDKQKEIRRKAAEKARKANKARNINPSEPAKEKKAKEAVSTEGVLSKAAKRKATAAAATSSPATKKTKTVKKAAAKEEEEEEEADADAPYNFAEHFVSGEGDEEVEEEEEEEQEDDEE
ncbi:hypothetical protein BGZ72_004277 [Mortierella alpina]|nr:hypothetical protein BGZ72_004277 [Mortierella alpina]